MTKPKFVDQYGKEANAYTWIAACCGARATKRAPIDKTLCGRHKGIRVWAGEYKEPFDNDKNLVTTVQTKNGPLSIGVRYVW